MDGKEQAQSEPQADQRLISDQQGGAMILRVIEMLLQEAEIGIDEGFGLAVSLPADLLISWRIEGITQISEADIAFLLQAITALQEEMVSAIKATREEMPNLPASYEGLKDLMHPEAPQEEQGIPEGQQRYQEFWAEQAKDPEFRAEMERLIFGADKESNRDG